MSDLNGRFRRNLRMYMKAQRMYQKVLAYKSGYSPAHIRRVLSGERPNTTLLFVQTMADTLGVTTEDLLR